MMNFKTKYGESVGVELFIQFPDLSNYPRTYLEADEVSGQTELSANGTDFSIGQYCFIGQPGTEKSEIIRLHAATAPTATVITLASATAFSHERGTMITFIPYNQIVVSRSTDDGVTYSALSGVDIKPDSDFTYIQRAADAATDYYKFRFYNSSDATYSDYSDAQIASGYADNSVASIKRRALDDLGEKITDLITDGFLNDSLWEARRELDQNPMVSKWSFRTSFNTDLGNIVPGTWRIAVPTDLRDKNTNKNILGIRIGKDKNQLSYQQFNDFMLNYENCGHTTLSGAVADTDVTITLASSGDFDESGSIYVAAQSVLGIVDSVDYTANNLSTNVLSGVTGIATGGFASGTDVWQEITFGEPQSFTIFEGYIYFDVPFEDDMAGQNIWIDYYKTMPVYNSDADILDEPEYDLFVNYLKWKIKYKKSNGTLSPQKDTDFQLWEKRKNDLISKEVTGQYIQFIPC